ncbi:uncharacterized protein [Drosophila bipectinata]|uniref:uncharacterized protein n=1 Tax=Drosophila bipectinata TaxID=42026 RepID=UPI0038B2875B
MSTCLRFLRILLCIYCIANEVMPAYVKLKNVVCTSLDKDFTDFEYCFINSVNKTNRSLSLKVKLFQLPITNFTLNTGFYKKINGFKPFLYNVTIDGCKFLKNPTSSPQTKFFYDFYKDVSNINHSCPYNHDLVVENMSEYRINHRLVKIVPFPEGDYMLQLLYMAYGINRAIVKIYISLVL